MNTRILDIIRNPEILKAEDLKLLESEIEKLPYMQSLRAIHLLGIHKYDHQNFQGELTKTAAYTTDKKILYKFINQNKFEQEKPSLPAAPASQQEEATHIVTTNQEKSISLTGIDYYTKSISQNKEEEKNTSSKITFKKVTYEPKTHIMDFYSSPITSEAKENSPISFYEKPISSLPEKETEVSNTPESKTDEHLKASSIIQNAIPEENYQWIPMQTNASQNIQDDNITLSPPTSIEENFTENKQSQEQDTHTGSSNVSSFINTWQNWLKIDRTAQISQQEKKAAIIDKFIESNPKISPIKENVDFVIKEKSDDISHLMTETLAQLYVEQKLYTKAINAFKILQEKYPEKAEIFERKIEEIKQRK